MMPSRIARSNGTRRRPQHNVSLRCHGYAARTRGIPGSTGSDQLRRCADSVRLLVGHGTLTVAGVDPRGSRRVRMGRDVARNHLAAAVGLSESALASCRSSADNYRSEQRLRTAYTAGSSCARPCLLTDDQSRMSEISQVVEGNPGLIAAVLRAVNSAIPSPRLWVRLAGKQSCASAWVPRGAS